MSKVKRAAGGVLHSPALIAVDLQVQMQNGEVMVSFVVLDVLLHGHLADTLHVLMLFVFWLVALNYGLLTFFWCERATACKHSSKSHRHAEISFCSVCSLGIGLAACLIRVGLRIRDRRRAIAKSILVVGHGPIGHSFIAKMTDGRREKWKS